MYIWCVTVYTYSALCTYGVSLCTLTVHCVHMCVTVYTYSALCTYGVSLCTLTVHCVHECIMHMSWERTDVKATVYGQRRTGPATYILKHGEKDKWAVSSKNAP